MGGGNRMFASTALVVLVEKLVWMVMHLISYSDYLTGFCELLLPLYRSVSHWFEITLV